MGYIIAVLFLVFVYIPLSVIFRLVKDKTGKGGYRRKHGRRRRKW